MKKYFTTNSLFAMLSLFLFFVLVSCNSYNLNFENEITNDGLVLANQSQTSHYANVSNSDEAMALTNEYNPDYENGAICSEAVPTSQRQSFPRENIFAGEGTMVLGGGDAGIWFYWVFGFDYNFIPSHIIIELVGLEAFSNWRAEFYPHGLRDIREISLRTLVEDFSITKADLTRVHEETYGLPMAEIDALVEWARNVDWAALCDDKTWEAAKWAVHVLTTTDIEALFSNDVSMIWASFPGFGVYTNGRAYSPEWILNNMERAIFEEQIPLHEIERILGYTRYYSQFDAIRLAAESTFQAAVATR